MRVSLNPTEKALLARGVSSDIAAALVSAGHTITSLKSKSIEQLRSLGLTESVANDIRLGRPPIPEATLLKLLFDNKWVCCVCRSETEPVVVHHIAPWAKSRSHEPPNLVVLCPNDHAKAHSKGDLSQNLTAERLRVIKRKWENQVKIDDSIVIRRAAQTAGEYWYFFNLLRLHEIAKLEKIDLKLLPHYSEARRAQILDTSGCLVPERADGMYAYSGPDAMLRYWYAKDLFLKVLDRLSVTNISDRLDRSDLGNSVLRNDIVYVEGAYYFKQLNNVTAGPNQLVRGTRSANSVQFVFTFDRWYATSSSAHSVWLTGRHAVGCFCRVGDVSRERGKMIIECTVLGICAELPAQKSRSYLSSSVPLRGAQPTADDEELPSEDWNDTIDDSSSFF
ncbi:HNH endonuclease signature motif containing protein [Burkholderia cepacia]|uniref:HNH endonuclease signature motif containing protein n=1 Tax=Burkholderia cepacia TaxID=292 RepID=UPI0009BDA03D|nr:HNH endonuclease signature motif containing protein [Burkholderia cepacia]